MIDGMAALVPQQHLAPLRRPSFHFQHLVHLKRLEPRMGQVKRNGNGRHTFGREPFVSQVAVRTKGDTATSELVVKLAHSFFQLAAFDPDAQITDANIE